MTARRTSSTRSGFTLIELLIVVTVISTLSLIVFPRVSGATRKAREATIKADLQTLRSAIVQFNSDTGCYPATLTDLVTLTAPAAGVDENGGTVSIPLGSYQGPYLMRQGGIGGVATGIPINPFTQTVNGALDTNVQHHWTYSNGMVSSFNPVTGNTLDGIPYASL